MVQILNFSLILIFPLSISVFVYSPSISHPYLSFLPFVSQFVYMYVHDFLRNQSTGTIIAICHDLTYLFPVLLLKIIFSFFSGFSFDVYSM